MKISVRDLAIAAACLVIGCNDDSSANANNKNEDIVQTQACEIEGQVRCGDACIDPKTDQKYCGADEKCEHFTACDAQSQVCKDAKCVAQKEQPTENDQPASCKSGEHEYDKTCEPDSVDHCGTHDNACSQVVEGWADGKCESGQCVPEKCQSAMHLNRNLCEADTIEHCGSPENNCATIEGWKDGDCAEGSCVAKSCKDGYHMDSKTCEADTIEHGGSAENKCADTIEGWADGKCESGQCVPEKCQNGLPPNGSSCEPDTIEHCGSMENNCAAAIEGWKDGECTEGSCAAKNCNDGYHITDAKTCEKDTQADIDAKLTADSPSFATDDGIPNGITFRLINKSGKDICFSGKFKPYIKKDGPHNGWNSDGSGSPTTQELECHITPPTSTDDGWPHWHVNDQTLAPGESKEFSLTEFKEYNGNGTTVQTVKIPMDTYANGEWYFLAEDNVAAGGPSIKLGFAAMESDGKRSNSAYIIHVRPVKASDAKVEKGKKYNLIIYGAETDSKYWYCD